MNNEKNTSNSAENEEVKEVQETEEIKADVQKTTETEKAIEPKEETVEKSKKVKNPNSKTFREYINSPKFKHGGMATVFTAGFIIIIVLINIVVSSLTTRFPSMNIDMTQGGTNTLSAQTVKIVQSVKNDTQIYIIGTEAQVKSDANYSQVAALAAKIAEKNSKIKVEYVDVDKNPTFASDHSIAETLTTGEVVVKTDKRSRVLANTDLFSSQQDSTTGAYQNFSLVDSALASAVSMVNSDAVPVAAVETGHTPGFDTTALKSLLGNNNFTTKDFNSLTDAVPANAQLLVLPTPSTDYTDAELKKLDAFLSDTKLAATRSLVITFDPRQQAMPKLANFLKEWGISVKTATLIAETDDTKVILNNASYILSQIGTKLALGGKSDYGYVPTPQACPVQQLFESQGTVSTYSLATSYSTSYLYDAKATDASKATKASYNTAVLAQKPLTISDKSYKANVIVLGSTSMLDPNILNATAYGNSAYMVDLCRYATGTTNSDTGVTMNQVQTNVTDIKINETVANVLGVGVFTVLIPLCVIGAGIFVYLRRRHL